MENKLLDQLQEIVDYWDADLSENEKYLKSKTEKVIASYSKNDKSGLIQFIKGLYPIDSDYVDTATIGELLLMKAIRTTGFDWRDLPTHVLAEYNRLCLKEENTGEVTAMLRKSGRIVTNDF